MKIRNLFLPVLAILILTPVIMTAGCKSGTAKAEDFSGDDACYLDVLKKFKNNLEYEVEEVWGYARPDIQRAYYCLKDINGDGINELVITSGKYNDVEALYTRTGKNVKELFFQNRHSTYGITSDGCIYERYKYINMWKLNNGGLVTVYELDYDWSSDDPDEDLERRDNEKREQLGISKSDMRFDLKTYEY